MKNFNHNSLVRDFVGAAFCLMMAFALLMMYSGCSEDNSPINGAHGGAAEEQGVYALAGRVGDVYPRLLKSAEEGAKDSLKYGGSVFAGKGTVVAVYELDSLTLDTTGRFFVDTVDNDSGRFAFENLTLNSPYVLIENKVPYDTNLYNPQMEPSKDTYNPMVHLTKYKEYSAVVDLRNVEKVNVSTLTTMKVPLLQRYFAEGNSFAQASKMAER